MCAIDCNGDTYSVKRKQTLRDGKRQRHDTTTHKSTRHVDHVRSDGLRIEDQRLRRGRQFTSIVVVVGWKLYKEYVRASRGWLRFL